MKQVYRKDTDGFYLEPVIIGSNDPIPSDCVEHMPPYGLYKPKYVDGVWVEGEDKSVLLKQAQDAKITELNGMCNKAILANFPYTLNGVTYYFPNDETAQKNFDKFYNAFKDGITSSPEKFTCYDANGKVQRVELDETTFPDLYKAHLIHIASNIAKFRDYLQPMVEATTDVQDTAKITWESI